ADAAGGLCRIPGSAHRDAAGVVLPGAAPAGGPAGDAGGVGPQHGDLAVDADPGADAVRLAVGHGRAAAGGAAAGMREAGADPAGRHAGLGTAAGIVRRRPAAVAWRKMAR